MVSEPPQPWPPPVATSPSCPPLPLAATFSLPPSLSSLRRREELPGAEQNNKKKKSVDKLIDTENSLAIRSNWVIAVVDFIWLQHNALMARSLVLPIESFRATIFPLVYAAKAIARRAWFHLRFDQTMGAESMYRSNGNHLAPLLFDPCATPFGFNQTPAIHLLPLSLCAHDRSGRDVIPFSLGRAAGLSVLSLAGNNFSSDIPATLGGLWHLTHLNLSHNALSGSVPPALAALSNLSLLDRFIFSSPNVATHHCRRIRRSPWVGTGKKRKEKEEEEERKKKKRKENKKRKEKRDSLFPLSSLSSHSSAIFFFFFRYFLSTFSLFFFPLLSISRKKVLYYLSLS